MSAAGAPRVEEERAGPRARPRRPSPYNPPMRRALLPPALLAAALALAPQEAPDVPEASATPAASEDHEDHEACAGCHPGVVESYRRSGMGNALGPLVPGELEGLAPVDDEPAGLRYRFEEDRAGAWIVESWLPRDAFGPDAERQRVQRSVRLRFAIGAGLVDRSYAAEVGGLHAFAPLEVLSATDDAPRHAALAPNHQRAPGTRFSVGIREECLACHTDRLPPRDYPLNLIPTDFEPRGIGCATCHGRADEHAAWRERELAGEAVEGGDPILAIDGMGWRARMSLCARCHLEGDARVALIAGERGQPPPGEDLLSSRAVFVSPEDEDDVPFVGHVERWVRSPCFLSSLEEGMEALTCAGCHDPHRPGHEPDERARVRAKCAECHEGSASPHAERAPGCSLPRAERGGRDCAACHMRVTEVFDVAGVRVHDHFVRARPPAPSTYERRRLHRSRTGLLVPFAWPGDALGLVEQDSGLALLGAAAAGFRDVARRYMEKGGGELSGELPMYHHVVGTLMEEQGWLDDARKAYERALLLDPELVESRVNLGLVLGRMGRGEEGLALLDAVIEAHPRAEGALRNRALVRLSLGMDKGFAEDLERAQEVFPRVLNARALEGFHRRQGRTAEADRWAREAERLGP